MCGEGQTDKDNKREKMTCLTQHPLSFVERKKKTRWSSCEKLIMIVCMARAAAKLHYRNSGHVTREQPLSLPHCPPAHILKVVPNKLASWETGWTNIDYYVLCSISAGRRYFMVKERATGPNVPVPIYVPLPLEFVQICKHKSIINI